MGCRQGRDVCWRRLRSQSQEVKPDPAAVPNNCLVAPTGPEVYSNMAVSQTENQLTSQATSKAGVDKLLAGGFTIESNSGSAGTLLKDARFSLFQGMTLRYQTLGKASINYATTGTFSPSGWFGNFSYTVFVEGDSSSCTFTATFSGDKV